MISRRCLLYIYISKCRNCTIFIYDIRIKLSTSSHFSRIGLLLIFSEEKVRARVCVVVNLISKSMCSLAIVYCLLQTYKKNIECHRDV